MFFKSSTLLYTMLTIACLVVTFTIISAAADAIRDNKVEQVQNSTPIMDCDPEMVSGCPTAPPQIDEFQDVIRPTIGFIFFLSIFIGLMFHGSRETNG